MYFENDTFTRKWSRTTPFLYASPPTSYTFVLFILRGTKNGCYFRKRVQRFRGWNFAFHVEKVNWNALRPSLDRKQLSLTFESFLLR